MVAEANNPTMVGLTGIVLMETRHTFQMVTKEDKYLGSFFCLRSKGNFETKLKFYTIAIAD